MKIFSNLDTESIASLSYNRSISIYSAIENSDSFKFIEALQCINNGHRLELILVKLFCEGVPSEEPFGVRYEEDFAILITEDESLIPAVIPVRQDFPILLHVNQQTPKSIIPTHLCIYSELPSDVVASWTPESFLARIYWWVEHASKGTLHKSIQPLEEPFFIAKDELIFPPMTWAEIEQIDKWTCTNICDRGDDGVTLVLSNRPPSSKEERSVHVVSIACPPIVHHNPELMPENLSALSDYLDIRFGEGFFKNKLVGYLREVTPSDGLEKIDDGLVIFMFHLAISREEGATPERMVTKAFLYKESLVDLGKSMGVLGQINPDDERWFYTLYGDSEVTIDNAVIGPLQTYKLNSSSNFANQSGLDASNKKITLVGLGSLGSTIFEMMLRAGHGSWVLVDQDHMKIHNITRHILTNSALAHYKADASKAQGLLIDATADIKAVNKNAALVEGEDLGAIMVSDLVIDASAGLEYQRYALTNPDLPRHAAIFIVPSGVDSVLFLEDQSRAIAIDLLEAQYYRAILNTDWGRNHLDVQSGTFVSGAGCRDVSLKLSYMEIAQHATTISQFLSDQISCDSAVIGVWQRDSESKSLTYHAVTVFPSNELIKGDYRVIIDEGLIQLLSVSRSSALPNETGGVLLGYYDFSYYEKRIYIVDALTESIHSEGTPSSFMRSSSGLNDRLEAVSKRSKGRVQYIGEWHSHPDGISTKQSDIDVNQLKFVSQHMGAAGLPGLQMIISDLDWDIYVAGYKHE